MTAKVCDYLMETAVNVCSLAAVGFGAAAISGEASNLYVIATASAVSSLVLRIIYRFKAKVGFFQLDGVEDSFKAVSAVCFGYAVYQPENVIVGAVGVSCVVASLVVRVISAVAQYCKRRREEVDAEEGLRLQNLEDEKVRDANVKAEAAEARARAAEARAKNEEERARKAETDASKKKVEVGKFSKVLEMREKVIAIVDCAGRVEAILAFLLIKMDELQEMEAESKYCRSRHVAVCLIEELMEHIIDPEMKRKIKEILDRDGVCGKGELSSRLHQIRNLVKELRSWMLKNRKLVVLLKQGTFSLKDYNDFMESVGSARNLTKELQQTAGDLMRLVKNHGPSCGDSDVIKAILESVKELKTVNVDSEEYDAVSCKDKAIKRLEDMLKLFLCLVRDPSVIKCSVDIDVEAGVASMLVRDLESMMMEVV